MASAPEFAALLHRSDAPSEPIARISDPLGRTAVVTGTKRIKASNGTPWPVETTTLCWHCAHPFDTIPLPLPTDYCPKIDVFYAIGNFCSWACMKAYNFDRSHYRKEANSLLISYFASRCCGKPVSIKSAPPRQALKVFGGDLTIEEFRSSSQALAHPRPIPGKQLPFIECQTDLHMHRQPAKSRGKRPPPPEGPESIIRATKSQDAAAAPAKPPPPKQKTQPGPTGNKPPLETCSASLKLKRNNATPPAQFDLLSKSMGLLFTGRKEAV